MDMESSSYEGVCDLIALTLKKHVHWMGTTFQHTCDQNENSWKSWFKFCGPK